MSKAKIILDVTPDRWKALVTDSDKLGCFVGKLVGHRGTAVFEIRLSREKLELVGVVPKESFNPRQLADKWCEISNDISREIWASA